MKKFFKFITVFCLIVFSSLFFVGCNSSGSSRSTSKSTYYNSSSSVTSKSTSSNNNSNNNYIDNGNSTSNSGDKTTNDKQDTKIIEVTSIKIDSLNLRTLFNNNYLTMKKGDKENIRVTILPNNATNKTIKWTSSNNSIATVKDGQITAVGVGSCIITATSSNNISAQCNLNVDPNYNFKLEYESLPVYIRKYELSSGIIETVNKEYVLSALTYTVNAYGNKVSFDIYATCKLTHSSGIFAGKSIDIDFDIYYDGVVKASSSFYESGVNIGEVYEIKRSITIYFPNGLPENATFKLKFKK